VEFQGARFVLSFAVIIARMYSSEEQTERTVYHMPIKKTLTDYLRLWFKWFLDPLGGFFNRLGLTPNTMTMLGLLGNTVGAYFLARGGWRIFSGAWGNDDGRALRAVNDPH
jgi:hypothetical protein